VEPKEALWAKVFTAATNARVIHLCKEKTGQDFDAQSLWLETQVIGVRWRIASISAGSLASFSSVKCRAKASICHITFL